MDLVLANIKVAVNMFLSNGWYPLLSGIAVLFFGILFSDGFKGSTIWFIIGGVLILLGLGKVTGLGLFENIIWM